MSNPNRKVLRYSVERTLDMSHRKAKFNAPNYDWIAIQLAYDSGTTWRELMEQFGMANNTLLRAVNSGNLILRDKGTAGKLAIQKYGPSIMGEEARLRVSKLASARNDTRHGRCSWFEVNGEKVQGTWERNIAEIATELDIRWTKKNIVPWEYLKNGVIHHYSPDFHLPEYDCYLEIKGFWWRDDREKMRIVAETYPDRIVHTIEKQQYKEILQTRKFAFLNARLAAAVYASA